MPQFAVRLVDPAEGREYFLLWSTVVDAPLDHGMREAEFREYWIARYGREGARNWPRLLHAARKKGVASGGYRNVAEVIAGNRAGPGETELTLEGIIEQYCRRRPEEEEGKEG